MGKKIDLLREKYLFCYFEKLLLKLKVLALISFSFILCCMEFIVKWWHEAHFFAVTVGATHLQELYM